MKDNLFLSAEWLYCILYALFFVCFFLLQISLVIMSGKKNYKNSPLKMEAIGIRVPDG